MESGYCGPGAQERLPSILMTAFITALAMLPIAIDSDNPGREIMGPMETIIIGGLAFLDRARSNMRSRSCGARLRGVERGY